MKLKKMLIITTCILTIQLVLFLISLLSSDINSSTVWSYFGLASALLTFIGGLFAPVAVLIGLIRKAPVLLKCGVIFLICNTIPIIVLISTTTFIGL